MRPLALGSTTLPFLCCGVLWRSPSIAKGSFRMVKCGKDSLHLPVGIKTHGYRLLLGIMLI